MDDLPTPVWRAAHGNLLESCGICSSSPEAMHFVIVMFTWNPLDSNPSFHALTRSTHSSKEVAMITRSSTKNSSQGTPTLKSLDKASSTMIKSRGLRTEPWWTPTPISNSSLYSEPTLTRLCALLYIACTRRTIQSLTPTFLITHHKTFRGTRSNAFSRSTKAKNRVRFLSLRSFLDKNFSWTWRMTNIASLVPRPGTKANCISSMAIISWIIPSTILSMTFITCSVSLRPL